MIECEDKYEHEWKRTKRHQGALTIALKLGLEKTVVTMESELWRKAGPSALQLQERLC